MASAQVFTKEPPKTKWWIGYPAHRKEVWLELRLSLPVDQVEQEATATLSRHEIEDSGRTRAQHIGKAILERSETATVSAGRGHGEGCDQLPRRLGQPRTPVRRTKGHAAANERPRRRRQGDKGVARNESTARVARHDNRQASVSDDSINGLCEFLAVGVDRGERVVWISNCGQAWQRVEARQQSVEEANIGREQTMHEDDQAGLSSEFGRESWVIDGFQRARLRAFRRLPSQAMCKVTGSRCGTDEDQGDQGSR